MNWVEFQHARQLLAEERLGARVREHQRGELDEDSRSDAILRARGMVSDGPR